jgi:hypothetical protein
MSGRFRCLENVISFVALRGRDGFATATPAASPEVHYQSQACNPATAERRRPAVTERPGNRHASCFAKLEEDEIHR